MNLDKLTVNVRPLAGFQAMDLGMMMARKWFMPLWGLWWRRMMPLIVLIAAFCIARAVWSWDIAWGWISFAIWWSKPFAEMPLVCYLSQKLFDKEFDSDQAWQLMAQNPKNDSVTLLTTGRLGFRRQLLMPILMLERQAKQRRQRLLVLSHSQSNALIWQTLAFLLIENLLVLGIGIFIIQLLPQMIAETLPLEEWQRHLPNWLEALLLTLYLLVISVVGVFFVASGFAAYICKRSVLEGWDIELKFRKLAHRHQASLAVLGADKSINKIVAKGQSDV